MLVETAFREILVASLILADFAMILQTTTWNLHDFRVGEKETMSKQQLFAQPVLQFVVFRELLAENRSDKLSARTIRL